MVFPAVLSRQGKSGTQVQALIDASVAVEATARDAAIAAAIAATNAVNPLTTLDLSDDFVSGGAASAAIGSLGWATSGGTITNVAGEAGHPGILRRETSATISTLTRTHTRDGPTIPVVLASESFDETWVFRLNTNDANTRCRLGFSSDWSADAPVSAAYVEKLEGDTSWFGACRAASAQSRTAALAAVDTGWHKVRIRRIDASTIGFTLDALAEVTLATNVPGAVAITPGTMLFNTAAANKTLDHDFFRLRISSLAR